MEPEVGDLLDDALVALGGAGERGLDALLAELLRARGDAASSRPATYEPSGRSCARSATVRQSHGAKHDTEPVWHAGPVRADAEQERVAVAVVAQLLDGERVPGGLALVPELARASGSRSAPRRSRA